MKRLVIYFHYDPAGRIDTACRIAVQAMQKYAKVLFVTNGTLTPADRVWVRQAGAGRIERDNTGFDVGAYKEPPLWRRGAGTPAIPLPGAAAAIIQQRRLLGLLAAGGAARKL